MEPQRGRALYHVSRSMTAWLVSRLLTPRLMILCTMSALPCAAAALRQANHNPNPRLMTAWLDSRLRTPRSMILRTMSALPCAVAAPCQANTNPNSNPIQIPCAQQCRLCASGHPTDQAAALPRA